jgi:hypothetical protein
MDRIRAFYAAKQGKYPAQTTPVRLREEESDAADQDPPRSAKGSGFTSTR